MPNRKTLPRFPLNAPPVLVAYRSPPRLLMLM